MYEYSTTPYVHTHAHAHTGRLAMCRYCSSKVLVARVKILMRHMMMGSQAQALIVAARRLRLRLEAVAVRLHQPHAQHGHVDDEGDRRRLPAR
jgi:hypothetical protein